MILRTLAFLLVFASFADGQTTITGRVIDPEGKPVANQSVLLHAVQESAGSNVASDTTDASGAFALNVPTTDPKSIYFVAVLYEGALYMGEMMRPPFPEGQDYIVQVGVNPVDLGAPANEAPAPAPPTTGSERTAGIFVVVAAVAIIAGLIIAGIRRRPPARRRWLVELARIEDEIADATGDTAILEKRRAELRTRLKAPGSG